LAPSACLRAWGFSFPARGNRLIADGYQQLPLTQAAGESENSALFETDPPDLNAGAKLLRPILSHLSNAAGLNSSPYFDAKP